MSLRYRNTRHDEFVQMNLQDERIAKREREDSEAAELDALLDAEERLDLQENSNDQP